MTFIRVWRGATRTLALITGVVSAVYAHREFLNWPAYANGPDHSDPLAFIVGVVVAVVLWRVADEVVR